MASVWLARQHGKHGFEKLVAVKMILPKFAQDPRFERMFLDEAGIASRITHPNVAQILDLGEEHGILYLAMEWVDGDPITQLRRTAEKKDTKVPLGVALRIMADTCSGLHFAHELRDKDDKPLGVVHRDVSQQNILVDALGIPKVIDFGIAKARDRISEETSAGMLKGKIHCMAPEQARGERVDRRADVFAVGAILYHLIAGSPPYLGDNHLATLNLLISGRPPMPLPPHVPAAVREVVARALCHKRDGRYATAADLRDALEAAMSKENLVTTTSGVAAYCREHLADRVERRKKAMAYALSAAGDRAQVAQILEVHTSADSSSGVAVVNAKLDEVLRASRAVLTTEPDVTVDAEDFEPAEASSGPKETSGASLGSAAIELPAPVGRRRRSLAIALGVGGICATVGILIALERTGEIAASSPSLAASAVSIVPAASTSATSAPAPPAETTATQAMPASSADPTATPTTTSSSRATRPAVPPHPRPIAPPAPRHGTPDLGSYR
jgi:serine/threonine protein kinase